MTKNCIDAVNEFEKENNTFADLSVEQLLYSAIKGTGIEDVKWVLESTDWEKLGLDYHNL